MGASLAEAQRPPAGGTTPARQREFTLLLIDHGEYMADVGRATGFAEGATFTLFRPVVVRHPVTRQALRDRFPIGALRLRSQGETMSLLAADGSMARIPAVGDILIPEESDDPTPLPVRPVSSPRRTASVPATAAVPATVATSGQPAPPRTTAPPPPASSLANPPANPPAPSRPTAVSAEAAPVVNASEAQELTAAWNETVGRPLDARITRWLRFLEAFPRSAYAPMLRREVGALVAVRDRLESREALVTQLQSASARIESGRPLTRLSSIDPPTVLRAGDPAVIALQLSRGATVSAVMLYVRRGHEGPFRALPMRLEGDGFARLRLPRAWLSTAGVDCFAEAISAEGVSLPLWRSATEPHTIEVEPPARVAPLPPGLTRIDLRFEQVDVGTRINAAGINRVQRFTLIEADFLRRVRLPWLYGYRAGFGVYDGTGIALSAVESDQASQNSTVVYGYQELEFKLHRLAYFIARGQLGVHDQGLVGGIQLRLRIGVERYTNLVVGGDVLTEVGQRAFFALNFHPTARLPMMAQGEVFNQSVAGGDPMFRFVFQTGWRFTEWFSLSARVSYQLRNLDNGGFGFGLSPSFDW